MTRQTAAAAVMAVALISTVAAQDARRSGTKTVTYDVTIQADGAYTGTMDLSISDGAVSGTMDITAPTKVIGKVAGKAKGADLRLDFPFEMVERQCKGQVEMAITLPAKAEAAATGTVAIAGCGRDVSDKLPGTIELKRAAKK